MSEKATKVYVKDYQEQMKNIENHLSEITKIVDSLPVTASFTKSLKLSVVNMQKKMDGFLAVGAELTEEQKAAIKAIKTGKLTEEQISAISALMESKKDSGSSKQDKTKVATKGKEGRKH